jgi:plasmid stability protein
MKNVTLSLDDDSYRKARIRAAKEDLSLSALVRKLLIADSDWPPERERLKADERLLRDQVKSFRGGDRVSRDDIHGR